MSCGPLYRTLIPKPKFTLREWLQVAALGAHHWQVAKSVSNGMTTSRVIPLDAGQRIDEVARMLAGDKITDAARDAARALLQGGTA